MPTNTHTDSREYLEERLRRAAEKESGLLWSPADNTRVGTKQSQYMPLKGERLTDRSDVRLDDGPMGFVPILGDILQGTQALIDLTKGNYGQAALGAGLLFVPNALEKSAKPFIKKVMKDGTVRFLRHEPTQTINLGDAVRRPYKGQNFIHHGTSKQYVRDVLDGETRAMSPSFAINRWGDYNTKYTPGFYGDGYVFIGDKSLLDNSVVFSGDAGTETVGTVIYGNQSIPSNLREEVAEKIWKRTMENPEIAEKIVSPKTLEYLEYPENHIYFEGKYRGTLPLEKFKYGIFPEPENLGDEKILKAFEERGLPITTYNGYDDKIETLLNVLNDNPELLFRDGGHIATNDKLAKLVERINRTSNADFVKRLLDEKRKVLNNPDGTVSTHELGYVDDGKGNAVVFPAVQSVGDTLLRYPYPQSLDRAIENRDTLMLSVPEAEAFTTGYKEYYPGFNKYGDGGSKDIDSTSHSGLIERYGVEAVRNALAKVRGTHKFSGISGEPGEIDKDSYVLPTDEYGNILDVINPVTVTAALPKKFNGSQRQARNYMEGYQKGSRPVSQAIDSAGLPVGLGLAGAMSLPYMISLGALGAAGIPHAVEVLANPATATTEAGAAAATALGASGLVDAAQGLGSDVNKAISGQYKVSDIPGTLLRIPEVLPGGNLFTSPKNLNTAVSQIELISKYPSGVADKLAEAIIRVGDAAETQHGIYKQLSHPSTLKFIFNPNADRNLAYKLPFRYSGETTNFDDAHYGDIVDQFLGKVPVPEASYDADILPGYLKEYAQHHYPGKKIPIRTLKGVVSYQPMNRPSKTADALLDLGKNVIVPQESHSIVDMSTGTPLLDPGGYNSVVSKNGDKLKYSNWDIWKFNPNDYSNRYLGLPSPKRFLQKMGLRFIDSKGTPIIHNWTTFE